MKKFLSFLLVIAVVMSFATIAMTVSAAENDEVAVAAENDGVAVAAADGDTSVGAGTDVSESGTSGKVYFEKPAKWAGTIFYTHIFEATGDQTSFFGWQSKKEALKEEDGKYVYDLSILDDSSAQISGGLKAGKDYTIMFSDNVGNESCGIMFNTNCIGDTAKVVSDTASFENNVDSTKHSYELSWTANAQKYGIPLMITSVGTVQGSFMAKGSTTADLIKTWDKDYPDYPNVSSFSPQSSARDHNTRLAELKTQLAKLVADGKVYYIGGGQFTEEQNSGSGGSSSDGSSSGGSSSDGSSSSGGSSSDGSSSVLKTKDGKTVHKDANGNYVDEDGNVVDASDVVETQGTVSTGEETTYIFVTLGVMLAAGGVYFLTRKKRA